MITPTIVNMMEEEKRVITFQFEKFATCDTKFWIKKYVNGLFVDCRIMNSLQQIWDDLE